ncbi:helix-turn-helix domain-containing protein [Micromonospora eburnea]|uniref:Transcriptional regulator, contains XRE-family HTH domain n=1 Tax=Micromonospora eburnea TaxID=227316 RepID=A0A1C6UJ55_9ACTN|nr:helix-turn-helix transcriptional regulator [Micromonospora eburnea]SCL54077.1 Transcriptional regulator, contains XRE-family HTH domain [Micromonospora eburnea]
MTTRRADAAGGQESVGSRIRRLRTERGLTQRELAEPQYSRAFLAAVEGGVRNPGDRLLAHVAQRLGVDPDDLRHGRPPGAATAMADALQEARRALSQGKIAHAEEMFARICTDATGYALPDLACWATYWLGESRLQAGDLPRRWLQCTSGGRRVAQQPQAPSGGDSAKILLA